MQVYLEDLDFRDLLELLVKQEALDRLDLQVQQGLLEQLDCQVRLIFNIDKINVSYSFQQALNKLQKYFCRWPRFTWSSWITRSNWTCRSTGIWIRSPRTTGSPRPTWRSWSSRSDWSARSVGWSRISRTSRFCWTKRR